MKLTDTSNTSSDHSKHQRFVSYFTSLINGWLSRQWFPFFILSCGLIGTLVFAAYVNRVAYKQEKNQFESTVNRNTQLMESELKTYISLLRASASLYSAQNTINSEQFTRFVKNLELEEHYPGISGIGYANRIVDKNNLAPEKVEIQFLEPLNDRNRTAIGKNIYEDPLRRSAMDQARDTGEVAATEKVTLMVNEKYTDKHEGFVMYVPVYSADETPESLEERRTSLLGFLYSPFRNDTLFDKIFTHEKQRGIDFAIYEGYQPSPEKILFSAQDTIADITQNSQDHRFREVRQIVVANKTWTIEFTSNSLLSDTLERSLIPLILGGGLSASFLVFILAGLQYRARLQAEKTTRKLEQSQVALHESQTLYQMLVESSSDLISVLDKEGRFLFISPSYTKTLGYKRQDLEGNHVLKFIHESEQTLIRRLLSRVQSGKPGNATYQLRHKKGHYLTFEGTASAILDEANQAELIITSSRNITQKHLLAQKKDEFLGIASHELRTPVTSIKAYTQYLQRKFLKHGDLEASQLLQKMDFQLNKLSHLISDLLDVSKIEAGKLQIEREEFILSDLVREVVEEVQRTTETHTIIVSGTLTKTVLANRERISQVISNLLSNAIKYSPQADTVLVQVSSTTKVAKVSVQDFGVGIAKENQTSVFDRFFREEGPKQLTFPGLGLGLYISSQILKRQGGKIWFESKPQNGSTFFFSLPFADAKKDSPQPASSGKNE